MARRVAPFGVFLRLMDGQPWMYAAVGTLPAALELARALRGAELPLFPRHQVWVAAPATIGRSARTAARPPNRI